MTEVGIVEPDRTIDGLVVVRGDGHGVVYPHVTFHIDHAIISRATRKISGNLTRAA